MALVARGRDPHFRVKAGRILDLHERCWQWQPLRYDEFVISTDEKSSIQARLRIHPSPPTRPGESMRVEHEYARGGAWAYLAALDVHRAKVFGRCEATTGIAPFGRLVDQIMSQAPYNTARRVFWIMDNGSSHRGEAWVRRMTQAHPRLVPVHGPVHASWLNQNSAPCISTCTSPGCASHQKASNASDAEGAQER